MQERRFMQIMTYAILAGATAVLAKDSLDIAAAALKADPQNSWDFVVVAAYIHNHSGSFFLFYSLALAGIFLSVGAVKKDRFKEPLPKLTIFPIL